MAAEFSESERGPAAKALLFLAFAAVAVVFLAGMSYVFYPQGHSRIVGGVFLGITVPLMVVTMRRWLPGLVALSLGAIFLCLLAIDSGHLGGPADLKIERVDGFVVLLFFIVTALLVLDIGLHEVGPVERTAVMVYAFAFGWLIAHDGAADHSNGYVPFDRRVEFPVMGVAIGALLFACLYRRLRDNRHRRRVSGNESEVDGL